MTTTTPSTTPSLTPSLSLVTAGELCSYFIAGDDGDCECTSLSESYAYSVCTEDCPTCFELGEEEDDECVMKYSIMEFSEVGVDGTILVLQ